MARVTVEDCVVQVPNRFELVMLAARRGRAISAGEAPNVDRDNDKNPVVALREIAEAAVNLDELRTQLVRGLQKQVEVDEPEEDNMALLMAGKEWGETVPAAEIEDADGMEMLDEAEDELGAEEGDGLADEATTETPGEDKDA